MNNYRFEDNKEIDYLCQVQQINQA